MVYAGSFWYSTIQNESWDHFDVHSVDTGVIHRGHEIIQDSKSGSLARSQQMTIFISTYKQRLFFGSFSTLIISNNKHSINYAFQETESVKK